jgi:hypothetical protein
MSPAVLGGILLIVGSYFVSKGEIFKSVFAFWVADLCWIGLAIYAGDLYGAITVFIGMVFGVIAFYKMHKGIIRKNLKW